MAYPDDYPRDGFETFTEDTVLHEVERDAQGVKTLRFVSSFCVYDMLEVSAVSEYFNPLVGSFDEDKTRVYFHGGHSLIFDSPYEILALKIAPYINPAPTNTPNLDG